MALVKKIIKAQEGVKLNVDQQSQTSAQSPAVTVATEPVKKFKKFKLGSREVDLTDEFLLDLEDELRNSGQTGNAVSEMMGYIKNGGIQGINEGGNFYGSNVGGTEQNTRRNRGWGIGKKDVIARQDASQGIANSIWNVYNRRNKPVTADKTDLSNQAKAIRGMYAYHGNDIDDNTWNNMDLATRVSTFEKALEGYGNKFGEYKDQDYDANKFSNINEQTFNLLKTNHPNLVNDYKSMSAEWMKDGVISPDELNSFNTKYGINLHGLFNNKVLTEEELKQQKIKEAEDLEQANKVAAEEEALKAKQIAYDPETGSYSVGGNPYTGEYQTENGNIYIKEGSPFTGLEDVNNEYTPYYKGKAYSYQDIENLYKNPNLSDQEKESLLQLKADVGTARSAYTLGDRERQGGRVDTGGLPGMFMSSQYAPLNSNGDYRIYETIDSNSPTTYGVTGKRTTVLEVGDKKYKGTIKKIGNRSVFEAETGEVIDLSGDPSSHNPNYYYSQATQTPTGGQVQENAKKVVQEGGTSKNVVEEYFRKHKKGGKILYAQNGTKLVYQDVPQQSTSKYKGVDFNKINSFTQDTRDKKKIAQDSATAREVFDSNVKLTDVDKADLAALGLDLTGLVAGFIPGANAVSGALGTASTAAQLYSDVKRDGFQWGDLGNAGMSLGLDALSIIPFAGNAAKTSKILKSIGKSQKVLGTIFAAYGSVEGAKGLANIISKGKDATIDDYKMLAQGLQSVGMAGKAGIRRLGTKKVNPEFNMKLGDKKLSFKTEDEAKAFEALHNQYRTSNKKLQGAADSDRAKLGEETNALAQQLKAKFPDIDINATFSKQATINPFTWKGFGEKGNRTFPVGAKQGTAKINETSSRQILDKGEGNWLQRYSSTWLRNSDYNPFGKRGSIKTNNQSTTPPLPKFQLALPERVYQSNSKLKKPGTRPDEVKVEKSNVDKANESYWLANYGTKDPDAVKHIMARNAAFEKIENDKKKDNAIIEKNNLGLVMGTKREMAKNQRLEQERLLAEKQKEQDPWEKIFKQAERDELGESIGSKREKLQNKRDKIDQENKKNKEFAEKYASNRWVGEVERWTKSNDAKQRSAKKSNLKESEEVVKKQTEAIKSENKNIDEKGKNKQESKKRESKKESKSKPDTKKYNGKRIKQNDDELDVKNKEPKKSRTKRYLRQEAKGSDEKQYRSDSHDSKHSKEKATNRRQRNSKKGKEELAKINVTVRQKGGIISAQNPYSVETGSNWGKLLKGAQAIASPANARLATTLVANKKLMGELDKAKKPTNADPVRFQRLKNVGLSGVQPQITEIDETVNSQRPVYSDAKLNTVTQLARNSEANKMKQGLFAQLSNQNQQIDAQNQQIGQQEALQNASIAQQNLAKQDAHRQWLLSNKLGLINSNAGAVSNRLLEVERKKELQNQRIQALEDQENTMKNQIAYENEYNTFQNPWNEKAKAAGKSWSDYYSGMSDLDRQAYTTDRNKMQRGYKLRTIQEKKNSLQKPFMFASGGKMTQAEKKELEELKASKKRQLQSDKAFNKLVLEKHKSHDKMLSLLSKDITSNIKNILKK